MKIEGSSQIAELEYNPGKLRLTVTFHGGGTYHYEPVTATEYTRLTNAQSKGAHFNEFIKNKKHIQCRKAGGTLTSVSQTSERVRREVNEDRVLATPLKRDITEVGDLHSEVAAFLEDAHKTR